MLKLLNYSSHGNSILLCDVLPFTVIVEKIYAQMRLMLIKEGNYMLMENLKCYGNACRCFNLGVSLLCFKAQTIAESVLLKKPAGK